MHDLLRLGPRVQAFDRAVQKSTKLCITSVRLSLGRLVVTDTVYEWVKNIMGLMLKHSATSGLRDEALLVKIFTNPGNDIPERFLRNMAGLVRDVDSNASVVSYSKGMVLL